ncbi:hypothetical protein AJ87_48165 [Rhizobium yanglingense]|nr:hypothetical protein AJ87_48165 [Rhizobium yanglingense]
MPSRYELFGCCAFQKTFFGNELGFAFPIVKQYHVVAMHDGVDRPFPVECGLQQQRCGCFQIAMLAMVGKRHTGFDHLDGISF